MIQMMMMISHYDIVALHSMWIFFLKGICVLERVEIIHKSKFLPGTVEKNSSTIRSSGRNRTYACAMPGVGSIPAGGPYNMIQPLSKRTHSFYQRLGE